MERKEIMLTTTDNPYNPITQFDDWYQFDEDKGYCTLEYMARVGTRISDDLSEEQQDIAWAELIGEILQYNLVGVEGVDYAVANEDGIFATARGPLPEKPTS